MKGIAIIYKSKRLWVRILWLVAVLALLALLIWHLYESVVSYFNFPISCAYRDHDDRPDFPDITVCNINPLAYERDELSWSDYINLTETRKKIFRRNGLTPDIYSREWSHIQSPTGYLSNFPVNSPNPETSNDMILEHKYYGWDYARKKDAKAVIKSVWNAEFSACYTIQAKRKDVKSIKGLELLIYLNNFPKSADKSLGNSFFTVPSTGVRFLVHERKTKPFFASGVNVGPGTTTTLHMSSTLRERQPRPHGNCETEKNLAEPDSSAVITSHNKYSMDACYQICVQQQFINECKCIFYYFQFTEHQLQLVNGKICGNQSLTNKDFRNDDRISDMTGLKDLICLNTFQYDYISCKKKCLHPCLEYQYGVTLSSSPWPQVSSHLQFYQKYIDRESGNRIKLFGNEFDSYGDILTSDVNSKDKIKNLTELSLIENNFLRLDIFFNKEHPMSLKETPAMPLFEFLSIMGGCWSLWLDLTVLHFVEIIEFFGAVFLAILAKRIIIPLAEDDPPDEVDRPPVADTM